MPFTAPEASSPRGFSSEQSYEWWQTRLVEEFFSLGHGGKPVLFFVNRDEAERLHSGSPDGIGSLEVTLSHILVWQGNVFEPVARRVEHWRRTDKDDPPPCLPLLAATVLAASEMHRSADARAHNYYKRLAEILHPPYSKTEDHTKLLRKSYRVVAGLWQELHGWLVSSSGMRGISTIRTAETQQRKLIGYAQSQAIVRASDLDGLISFLQKAEISSSASAADQARLLEELRLWSRTRSVFSPRLREALETGEDDDVLGPLLIAIASAGKQSPGRTGSRRLQLLLAAEDDLIEGWQLKWHAPVLGGVLEDSLHYNSGKFTISALPGDRSYTVSEGAPDPAAALARGLEAQGNRTSLRIKPGRHVIAMREDPEAGCWVEVGSLTLFEPHLLLVDEIGENFVAESAEELGVPWYGAEETSADGWFAVPEFEIENPRLLEKFATDSGLSYSRSPAAKSPPRLTGGLRTRTNLSRRCYLLGGEPDILIPESFGGSQILLDGEPLEVLPGEQIKLRGRGLSTGQHRIESSRGSLQFFLEPLHVRLIPGNQSEHAAPEDKGRVYLPYSEGSYFIRADATAVPARTSSAPAWWRSRNTGLGPGGCFRQVPEEAVWLVTLSHSQKTTVVQLRDTPPAVRHLNNRMKEFWRLLVLDEQRRTPHHLLWKEYREAVLSRMPRQVFRRV